MLLLLIFNKKNQKIKNTTYKISIIILYWNTGKGMLGIDQNKRKIDIIIINAIDYSLIKSL